jgi:hypothetical protein
MVRLHFAECSRITEVWSEVDAASRRQQLTRCPAGAPSAIGITFVTARLVCEKRSVMNQHNDRSDDPKPVIEPGRDRAEHVELTTRALHLRIRQQEILAELGVLALHGTPDCEVDIVAGMVVRSGTPDDIAQRLHGEIVKALAQPEIRERLSALGFEPVASTRDEFAAWIKAEIPRWRGVIHASTFRKWNDLPDRNERTPE